MMRYSRVGGAEMGRSLVLGQVDPAAWSADTGRSIIFGDVAFGEWTEYGPFKRAMVVRTDRGPILVDRLAWFVLFSVLGFFVAFDGGEFRDDPGLDIIAGY